MNLFLLIIICVLINVLSKYLYKFIEELRTINKVKKQINSSEIEFQKIINGIDKDFYNDIKKDDIDLEK